MVKTFIGIESCQDHYFSNQQVRDTWLKGYDVQYKFFLGRKAPYNRAPEPDEMFLPVDDGHHQLMRKRKMEFEYVLSAGYDFYFHCHTDTYVHIPRLLASGYEGFDWIGMGQGGGPGDQCTWPILFGGAGVWFSRYAMETTLEVLKEDVYKTRLDSCSEDWEQGRIFKDKIARTVDPRYTDRMPGPAPENDTITAHCAGNTLRDKTRMLAIHSRALEIKC